MYYALDDDNDDDASYERGFGLPWKLPQINVVVEPFRFFLLTRAQLITMRAAVQHTVEIKSDDLKCKRVGRFLNGFKRTLIHSIYVFVRAQRSVRSASGSIWKFMSEHLAFSPWMLRIYYFNSIKLVLCSIYLHDPSINTQAQARAHKETQCIFISVHSAQCMWRSTDYAKSLQRHTSAQTTATTTTTTKTHRIFGLYHRNFVVVSFACSRNKYDKLN